MFTQLRHRSPTFEQHPTFAFSSSGTVARLLGERNRWYPGEISLCEFGILKAVHVTKELHGLKPVYTDGLLQLRNHGLHPTVC